MEEGALCRTINTTAAKILGKRGGECFLQIARKNGEVLSKETIEKIRTDGTKFAVDMTIWRINLPLKENAQYRSSKTMTDIRRIIENNIAEGKDVKILWNEYYLEEFRTRLLTYPDHFKEVISRWPEQFTALFPTCPDQFKDVISTSLN